MFNTWCSSMFYLFLHKIDVYKHFSFFNMAFKMENGRKRLRDYFLYIIGK